MINTHPLPTRLRPHQSRLEQAAPLAYIMKSPQAQGQIPRAEYISKFARSFASRQKMISKPMPLVSGVSAMRPQVPHPPPLPVTISQQEATPAH
jgi:hypothetical protein